jgi:hypothetical protein
MLLTEPARFVQELPGVFTAIALQIAPSGRARALTGIETVRGN